MGDAEKVVSSLTALRDEAKDYLGRLSEIGWWYHYREYLARMNALDEAICAIRVEFPACADNK